MATDIKLDHDAWEDYFTRFMQERTATHVSIEVEAPELGHQVEAHDLMLETLLYDVRDDVFEIAAMQPGPNGNAVVRHLISHPVAVQVDSPTGILPTSIAIDGEDGVRTLVHLKQSAALSG